MKSRFFILVTLVAATGCASNAQLRSEVDACRTHSIEQEKEIARLNGQVVVAKTETASSSFAQAGSDMLTAAGSAWNWSLNRGKAEYHAIEADAKKCYDEQTKLQTWADYKALAIKCWQVVQQ